MHNEFDHRLLGAKYDLFSFFEEGPGLPVWHEHGLRIKNALIAYWRELHMERGYREIQSPMLLDKKLWERSGHCDYFSENMFFSSVEKRDYVVKPMSCPGAILVYNQKRRSHAELPLRLSELGHVHRNENSGSLHGLMRVRSFVQDDAHIFCAEEDLAAEILEVIKLMEEIMGHCGLSNYRFVLSLRGEAHQGFLGSDADWEMAEAKLEAALSSLGHAVIKRPGEAKFYGPSLDLHLKDVHGRDWQCSSLQLDFNLPARFDVHYFDQNQERKVPYMLHRAIFGSLERFIGIMLENYGKHLPFWLHPVQYRVLSVIPAVNSYAKEMEKRLRRKGFQVESDFSDRPLKEKIRRAHNELVHSIVIVGEKEIQSKQLVAKNLAEGLESVIQV